MGFDLEIQKSELEKGDLAELKRFTFSNGRKFPTSYVEFVQKYGYGLSVNLFLIYIPMKNYPDSIFVRSKEIIATYDDVLQNKEKLWFKLEPDLSYEKLKYLVPFSMSENGHYLFWDINGEKEEFDIYITDFRGMGFIKVGNSLYEFFDKVTSTADYKTVLPFNENPQKKIFKPLEWLNKNE